MFGRFGSVRFLRAFLAMLALCIGALPALAEAYRLAPGDTIRARIIRLGNETHIAMVNAEGEVRLPFLGTYSAENKTLDELSEDIALQTAGRQIALIRNGVDTIIVFDENDIFLDIETYRPVTVIGAVATPGRVAYEPGLTLRAAIGTSGGLSYLGAAPRIDQSGRLRPRFEELRQTEAWLLAELWRLDALLGLAPPDALPEAYEDSLDDRLDADDLTLVQMRIAGALAELEGERAGIDARVELAQSQIFFLEEALEQYVVASGYEEERLQAVLALAERGLSTATNIDSARTGALNVSSRLLTTQAELAKAERELRGLVQIQDQLDSVFEQEQLRQKARVEQQLAELRAQLSALRQDLAVASVATDEVTVSQTYLYLIHGRRYGEDVTLEAEAGDILQPGDVVEVLLVDG